MEKALSDSSCLIEPGRLFQMLIVLGRKDVWPVLDLKLLVSRIPQLFANLVSAENGSEMISWMYFGNPAFIEL